MPDMQPNTGIAVRPEVREKINAFLDAWWRKSFNLIYSTTSLTWQSKHKTMLDTPWLIWFRKNPLYRYVIQWEYLATDSGRPLHPDMIIDVSVMLTTKIGKKHSSERRALIRLIKESAPYTPSADGVWGVNPVSIIFKESGGRHGSV